MQGKTFNVRVGNDDHKRLKVLAARMGIGISEILRKAATEFCEKHEAEVEASAATQKK